MATAKHPAEPLRAVAEAQSSLRRALARVEWQAGQLERAAEIRERAARRVLPQQEDAARAYLVQRWVLLERRRQLQELADLLGGASAELAGLRARLAKGPTSGSRPASR